MSGTGQNGVFVLNRKEMMTGEEPDRRTQRSREALIHSLLELIEKKHYDRISVQDIVRGADVGRSTFYAHFHDKDELLLSGFEYLLDSLVRRIVLAEDGVLEFDATMLFQHAAGHLTVFRTLMRGSGFELIIRDGQAALSRKIEQRLKELLSGRPAPSVALPLVANTLAGGLLVMLKWWLDNKMPCPPEVMNAAFQQLVMQGIRSVLAQPAAGRQFPVSKTTIRSGK
jgi:AcrR family transcriptional regulator